MSWSIAAAVAGGAVASFVLGFLFAAALGAIDKWASRS